MFHSHRPSEKLPKLNIFVVGELRNYRVTSHRVYSAWTQHYCIGTVVTVYALFTCSEYDAQFTELFAVIIMKTILKTVRKCDNSYWLQL